MNEDRMQSIVSFLTFSLKLYVFSCSYGIEFLPYYTKLGLSYIDPQDFLYSPSLSLSSLKCP